MTQITIDIKSLRNQFHDGTFPIYAKLIGTVMSYLNMRIISINDNKFIAIFTSNTFPQKNLTITSLTGTY